MSARKPKPTELKEQTSPREKLGLSRLFASANALVPFETPAEDKTLKLDDPRLKQQTQTPLLPSDTTSVKFEIPRVHQAPTKILPTNVTSPTLGESVKQRTSVTKIKSREQAREKARTKEKTETNFLPWILIAAAIGLFSYVAFAPGSPMHAKPSGPQSRLSDQQIQERLQFHREFTGSRLNRERIDVQIQNHLQSPQLEFDAHKVKAPDMMNGLPLTGEEYSFSQKRKADRVANPSNPDDKIMYGLQEEQDRANFEAQARKAWMNEFIENARKDGYAVKFDRSGNIETKLIPEKERLPNLETGPSSSATTDTILDTN